MKFTKNLTFKHNKFQRIWWRSTEILTTKLNLCKIQISHCTHSILQEKYRQIFPP